MVAKSCYLPLLLAVMLRGSQAGVFRHPPVTHRHLVEKTMKESLVVEFEALPKIERGDPQAMQAQRDQFFDKLKQLNITIVVRAVYDTLINGVSIELADAANTSAIVGLPNVKNVFYNYQVSHPSQQGVEAAPQAADGVAATLKRSLDLAHNMTGVSEAHSALKITGKGIKIGIIDTGIDYTHPAFGACNQIGGGCRVAFGKDFVGDDYNSRSQDNPSKRVPQPGNNPRDCAGHGTHVAGIVGGKDDTIVGVAPDVTLGAYRIFGCQGSTASDIVISAMETAFKDGMDIISLSIGGGSSWPDYPTAKAASRLADKGLIVMAAMGNDGSKGLWEGSSPGLASGGLGVASFDNQLYVGKVFQESPDNREIQFSVQPSQGPLLKDGELAISSSDINSLVDGCDPYPGVPFAGKIVLVRQGTCSFLIKALNAQAGGAIGVIIYNSKPNPLVLSVQDSRLTIPVAGISLDDGTELVKRSSNGVVRIHWLQADRVLPNPSSSQVSTFSSWGLSPDLAIKPDLGAPGGLIYSSWPVALGKYSTLSGTSMATPYLAGVAALYLSVNNDASGKVDPSEMKQVLQNSAVPSKLLDLNVSAPVARQGAGLINAMHVLKGNTRVTPCNLQLVDSPNRQSSISKKITIKNMGTEWMRYKLTHLPAASVNGTNSYAPTLDMRSSRVVISPSKINLAPGFRITVEVIITPNNTQPKTEHWIYSGYIVVTPVIDDNDVNPDYNPVYVPYAGYKGNYKSYKILPVGDDGPFVQNLKDVGSSNPKRYSANETATFTFDEVTNDYPVFRTRLLHPTPMMTCELYNATKDVAIGYVSYQEFLGITPEVKTDPSYYYSVVWSPPSNLPAVRKDPVLKPQEWTPVPDGTYYVILTVRKALGDGRKRREGDIETWRSPNIVIKTNNNK